MAITGPITKSPTRPITGSLNDNGNTAPAETYNVVDGADNVVDGADNVVDTF